MIERLELIKNGLFKLLYVAPERFSEKFLEQIRHLKINLLVVDEVHCAEQWGKSFRPAYMGLKQIRNKIGYPPLAAFTATADLNTREKIVEELGMHNPKVFTYGFDRPNIHLNVLRFPNKDRKTQMLLDLLKRLKGPGLIFAATIKEVDEIREFLSSNDINVGYYHGQMKRIKKIEIQNSFLEDKIPILVVTKAFGMGIDKPNIRFIIHYTLPESINDYYQEIGRAGRDGQPSVTFLLYTEGDEKIREKLIEYTFEIDNKIKEFYEHFSTKASTEKVLLGKNIFHNYTEVLDVLMDARIIKEYNVTDDGLEIIGFPGKRDLDNTVRYNICSIYNKNRL